MQLAAQVDAAINPGNSGGPVLDMDTGKIAGIAFQGRKDGEALGYMIPTDIIRCFFDDIADGHVDGTPDYLFNFDWLESEAERRYLGMKPGQSGIYIGHVSPAAGTNSLRVGDVLVKRAVGIPLEVIGGMLPRIMVEVLGDLVLPDAAQYWRVQYQPSQMLGILSGKAANRQATPTPSQHIDLLNACFCNDGIYRRIDVLDGIIRVRQKTVIYRPGLPKARDIQSPHAITFSGEPTNEAIVLIIDIEFVGGISHAVDHKNVPVRLLIRQRYAIQV